jgi:hypothetical protein
MDRSRLRRCAGISQDKIEFLKFMCSAPLQFDYIYSKLEADQRDRCNKEDSILKFQKAEACGPKHIPLLERVGRMQFELNYFLLFFIFPPQAPSFSPYRLCR